MNSLNPQVLEDGPLNTVVKFNMVLDSSDLAQEVLIDPATLLNKPQHLRVKYMDWDIENGLAVYLFWDALVPTPIWRMVGRSKLNAESYGGLTNDSTTGRTGKILISTQGWTSGATLSASFVLKLLK